MNNILKYSLLSSLFLLPISTSFIIWDKYSYFSGNFSPWTTVTINLSDILIFLSLFLYLLFLFRNETERFNFLKFFHLNKDIIINREPRIIYTVLALAFFLFIPFFFANDYILHLFLYFKFFAIFFVFIFIPDHIISKKEISNTLLFAFLIQVIIAIYQFSFQSSIGLHFLGEPDISKYSQGIAKIDLESGKKMIRPYGTMLHSNILGIGALIVYFLSINSSFAPLRYLLLIAVILSFSRVAWLLAGIIFILNFLFKHRSVVLKILIFSLPVCVAVFPFLLRRFSIFDSSYYDRIGLFNISLEMISDNPLGVGLGNFILKMSDYSGSNILPWNMNPVHNTFALLANEGGVVALMLILFIVYFLYKSSKSSIFSKLVIMSIIGIIGFFDHFFLTSTLGITLFCILLRFL